jgi:Zn-dependent protease/CBS domain-containing protein
MINDSIRLGRIAGIPLAMNWSVLVIVWLLTWGLAADLLPEAAPGYTTAAYWAAGLAAAFVFFASLLAHELSHAIVARRAGMKVEGMTLWLFGGVAKLGGLPPNAAADLRIAAVGPGTSLALSLGFGVITVLLGVAAAPDLLVTAAAWLAGINLVLALFNLIPGAPLDGGRVLRALLWRRHGDWVRAAVSAARAGQVVGYGVIGLGLAELFLGAGFGGLWMVFIGWFILVASRAERDHVVTESALRGVQVGDVMTRNPVTAPGWITVQELIDRYLFSHPHSAYPVEDLDGRVEGLVTLRQVRRVSPERRPGTRVADVALPMERVRAATADQLVTLLLETQEDSSDETGGRVLVFDRFPGPGRGADEGRRELVGIVTPTDIARAADIRALHRVQAHGRP